MVEETPLRHEVLERQIFSRDSHGPWSETRMRIEIEPGEWETHMVDDALMRLGDQWAADHVRGKVRDYREKIR